MSNTTITLVFVMVLNLVMFLAQASMDGISPNANTLYNYNGSVMQRWDSGGYQLDSTNINETYPSSSNLIEVSTGNFLTDTLSSIGSWFLGIPGVKYIYTFVTAPYNIVTGILPPELGIVAFGFGVFWNAITVFLLVSFFWGRE